MGQQRGGALNCLHLLLVAAGICAVVGVGGSCDHLQDPTMTVPVQKTGTVSIACLLLFFTPTYATAHLRGTREITTCLGFRRGVGAAAMHPCTSVRRLVKLNLTT